MNKAMMLATMGGAGYYSKLRQVFKTNLLAYFPLNEPSGNDINEKVAARNGISTNLTRNVIGYKGNASTWGATSYANIYAAANQLNVNEFTINLWININKDLWLNGSTYKFIDLRYTGIVDEICILKNNVQKSLRVYTTRNGLTKIEDVIIPYINNWINVSLICSASANKIEGLINGVKFWDGYNTTAIGTHSGAALRSDLAGLGSGYGTLAEFALDGSMCHLTFINRAATQLEVQKLLGFNQLIFVGDSRTAAKMWCVSSIGNNYISPRNVGIAGYSLLDMYNSSSATISKFFQNKKNYVVIFGGVNDYTVDVNTIYTRLRDLALAFKNAGAVVAVCTEIDAQDTARLGVNWSQKYLDLNVLIRANYLQFADYLIDFGANPLFQNALNTDIFSDKIHLTTPLGYTELANTAAPIINQMINS